MLILGRYSACVTGKIELVNRDDQGPWLGRGYWIFFGRGFATLPREYKKEEWMPGGWKHSRGHWD